MFAIQVRTGGQGDEKLGSGEVKIVNALCLTRTQRIYPFVFEPLLAMTNSPSESTGFVMSSSSKFVLSVDEL